MKKRIKKVKVSWAYGSAKNRLNIDFGLFGAHKKNQIEVDERIWIDYVRVRAMFENLHKTLVDKIK